MRCMTSDLSNHGPSRHHSSAKGRGLLPSLVRHGPTSIVGHIVLGMTSGSHAVPDIIADVGLTFGSFVKSVPYSSWGQALLSRPSARSFRAHFLQMDAHREELCLLYPGCSTARRGGMSASPYGGLMPDDRREGIVQGRAQAGDRGLLLDRSPDQMSAAR
jgi:hypothetical protein